MSSPSVGDGSGSSGGTRPGAPLRDDEVVPTVNPDQFVIIEDLEQMLRKACDALKTEPPVFEPRDCVYVQGDRYYGQDAIFSSLQAVVGESGKEILDYNYYVAQSYRERLLELERISSLFVEARVAELEAENARLMEHLASWSTFHGRV
ncbi:hypothetical protein AHAS_Ahas17G0088100 [Arachis hypogaea]